ncbi:GLE1-like protein-domain-containing protein [Tricladium varicosporioides]|nr:GLE1-like protein-domain-containing protein [Hymenoscyphus varicosporioides]
MSRRSSRDDNLSHSQRRTRSSSTYDHTVQFENRNSEDVHKEALAAAQAEHDRVREVAMRAFELEILRLEQLRLHQIVDQEEERVRIETERAHEAVRLRELENKARQIPVPPPRLPTPPPAPVEAPKPPPPPVEQVPKVTASSTSNSQHQSNGITVPPSSENLPKQQPVQAQQPVNPFSNSPSTTTPAVAAPRSAPQSQAPTTVNLSSQTSQPPAPPPSVPATSVRTVSPQSAHILPHAERYTEIHKRLKALRKYVKEDVPRTHPTLKKRTGEMRRELNKYLGQLTDKPSENKKPLNKIAALLVESLTSVASPPCNPGEFMVSIPQPKEGAMHNGDSLPCLFIYLLNIFSKNIVRQWVAEAGENSKAADPIGIVAVSTFANPQFLWRGQPLIDILMAKIRIVCPVVFGFRGSEKTVEGRERIGWWKSEGQDVPEQDHFMRMNGIAAGYASISLRNFSKSPMVHPWPPFHYWQAMATIVNTPAAEACSTQYLVLKGMLDSYEDKFLSFYGSAGLAALRIALVDFPAKADSNNIGAKALKVLADKLIRDQGLRLQ